MAARVRVLAGVTVWRAVAAKRRAAFLAGPQVDPIAANLHTFLALGAARPFDRFDGFDMGAFAGNHFDVSQARNVLRIRSKIERRVAGTGYEVVIDHPGRLHQGVADRRADKLEPALQQVAAHRVGFGRARWNVGHPSPAVLLRLVADETPEVSVEASQLLARHEERFRVLDRGCNLQTVSYDADVAEQAFHLAWAIAGNPFRAKSIERLPIVLPFL
jgi:hypothetical protein